MKVGVATLTDGSQVLVSIYDDGAVRVAERLQTWGTWGPPAEVTFEADYDYRPAEGVLLTGLLWGERDA